MSGLEQMKEQLEEYQKELELMRPIAKYYYEIVDLENAIWTLQQRIREAEDREAICNEVYPEIEVKPRLNSILRINNTEAQDD